MESFAERCVELLDDVTERKHTLVVTKDGNPVVWVLPVDAPADLRGTVEYLVSDDELIKPLYEEREPSCP